MSPYENRLRQETFRRAGYVAFARPGEENSLVETARNSPTRFSALIHNVNVFTQFTSGRFWVFVFLEFSGTEVETVASLLRVEPWFAAFTSHLSPHPRATTAGSPWLRMELITIIGPTLPPGREIAHLGLMSGLKPASELTYRTLHQTIWPGVIDQMARSHYQHWITFLAEFGAELFLFTYCEHVGTDEPADAAAMAADPVTRRWWTHTDPCLLPLCPGGGVWLPMQALTPVQDRPVRE